MNIPNRLSLLRIILIPVMLVCFVVNFPYHMFVALAVFAIASFTDFLDGYIARKYNMVTDMGKFLDPIADKLLTTTALILLACYQVIPNPYGMICLFLFVSRDFVISALRQIYATKKCVIAADKWGKYKTFTLDIALIIMFVFAGMAELSLNQTLLNVVMWIGYSFVIIASILNIISGTNYLVKNRAVFAENNKKQSNETTKEVENNSEVIKKENNKTEDNK